MNIVTIHNDEPRAGTHIIAEGFGRKHKTILNLIEKYQCDFFDFESHLSKVKKNDSDTSFSKGLIRQRVKTGKKGQPVFEYLLNEDQAMFLGTLLRNSEVVVQFKKNLIKEFSKVRKQLQSLQSSKQDPQYQVTRAKGKLIRREATDTIKSFVAYAESCGSTHADKYYMILSTMVNSTLFVVNGKFKNMRESMSTRQLMTVATVEQIVDRALQDGMNERLHYKEIFKLAKSRVVQFASLYGKTEVIDNVIEHNDRIAVAA